MRLNRFLAAAGFGSRRSCEQFIRDGKVSVNGHFITDLSTQVSAEDDVRVAGKPAKAEAHTYLILHKPRGYVCTRSDERGRKTIFDLIPGQFGRLFNVGRLDKDSEGLLLLTNDGNLSQRLTHPTHQIDKEYEVMLDKAYDPEITPKLLKGIFLEEGRARMESVRQVAPHIVKVVLRQGIKRQIREMFFRMGYEVKRLMRIRIGRLMAPSLKPGAWRLLNAKEVASLEETTPRRKPSGAAKSKSSPKKSPAKPVSRKATSTRRPSRGPRS